jgi:hypothetical protein
MRPLLRCPVASNDAGNVKPGGTSDIDESSPVTFAPVGATIHACTTSELDRERA